MNAALANHSVQELFEHATTNNVEAMKEIFRQAEADGEHEALVDNLPILKNDDGSTLIHQAALHGSVDVCRLLIDFDDTRLTVHKTDPQGRTPLHLAAQNGHESVCELLVTCGADNDEDDNGSTPLDYAELPSVKQLLKDAQIRRYFLITWIDGNLQQRATQCTYLKPWKPGRPTLQFNALKWRF
jgi:hypothetical protein